MDTIATLSTAPALAGVGIIRISGENAFPVLKSVFTSKSPLIPRQLVYGSLHNTNGIVIDHCMAVFFSAPASFTGEDVCEIHCHGSLAVLNSALSALYSSGARPAMAGEFTKRAFLNGKLDLLQAEAIGELIASDTEEAARNAAAMLGGTLGRTLDSVYISFTNLLARFRAVADYPEEDIEPAEIPEMLATLASARDKLAGLLEDYKRGKLFREGIDCAIIGCPNVGKSSFLNALAGFDRAIVTNIPGTTRDIIEHRITLGGLVLRLQDTAGLRSSEDEIESLGIALARRAAADSALCVALFDGSQPLSQGDLEVVEVAKKSSTSIYVLSKSDLTPAFSTSYFRSFTGVSEEPLRLSVRDGSLTAFEAKVQSLFDVGGLRFDGTLMTSVRQEAACAAARTAIESGMCALSDGTAPDMALYDIEVACERLGELFGRSASADIVDRVFANFCIGK